jgi:hypothetical protein
MKQACRRSSALSDASRHVEGRQWCRRSSAAKHAFSMYRYFVFVTSTDGRLKRAAHRPGADELACKPDPVPGRLAAHRSATIHLGLPSPTGSCDLPADSDGPPSNACAAPARRRSLLVLLRVGFTEPPRSPGVLVVSYTTVSPLPRARARGGLFSVALSRGSPRVAVDNHPALRSPDFPRHRAPKRQPGDAAARPARPRRSSYAAGIRAELCVRFGVGRGSAAPAHGRIGCGHGVALRAEPLEPAHRVTALGFVGHRTILRAS